MEGERQAHSTARGRSGPEGEGQGIGARAACRAQSPRATYQGMGNKERRAKARRRARRPQKVSAASPLSQNLQPQEFEMSPIGHSLRGSLQSALDVGRTPFEFVSSQFKPWERRQSDMLRNEWEPPRYIFSSSTSRVVKQTRTLPTQVRYYIK